MEIRKIIKKYRENQPIYGNVQTINTDVYKITFIDGQTLVILTDKVSEIFETFDNIKYLELLGKGEKLYVDSEKEVKQMLQDMGTMKHELMKRYKFNDMFKAVLISSINSKLKNTNIISVEAQKKISEIIQNSITNTRFGGEDLTSDLTFGDLEDENFKKLDGVFSKDYTDFLNKMNESSERTREAIESTEAAILKNKKPNNTEKEENSNEDSKKEDDELTTSNLHEEIDKIQNTNN